MAKKKDIYKIKPLNENKKNIIQSLIEEYDIETAEDIQEALKDLLGGTIKSMMESEMDEHLGMNHTSVEKRITTVMGLRKRVSTVTMEGLSWMCHRIAIVHSNHKS